MIRFTKNIHIAIIGLLALAKLTTHAADQNGNRPGLISRMSKTLNPKTYLPSAEQNGNQPGLKSGAPWTERLKMASMDERTLKKIDEVLEKLPKIVSLLSQQFNEVIQGSIELKSLKKIDAEIDVILENISQFNRKNKYASWEADQTERKQREHQAIQRQEAELKKFLEDHIHKPLREILEILETLIKQVSTLPEDMQIDEAHRKNRELRVESIKQLRECLQEFHSPTKGNLSLTTMSAGSANLQNPLVIQAGLEEFKKLLQQTIEQFKKISFGGSLYESLDNNIKELIGGLKNVSQSVSDDFKEVIGYPILLDIRKKLAILAHQSKEQSIPALVDIKMQLTPFHESLQDGQLYKELCVFCVELEKQINQETRLDLAILDHILQNILATRSGLLGALTTINGELTANLHQVVDKFDANTKRTVEHSLPKAAKKIFYYIPCVATATLSALWVSHKWLNNQLSQDQLVKGSSLMIASLGLLPAVDPVIDWLYQDRKN